MVYASDAQKTSMVAANVVRVDANLASVLSELENFFVETNVKNDTEAFLDGKMFPLFSRLT